MCSGIRPLRSRLFRIARHSLYTAAMRYSLRWLLLAMAYVALVAGAIRSGSFLLADVVWAVTLCAVCYTAVVACIANEKVRAMAIGFVVLAAVYIGCAFLVPHHVPGARFIPAASYVIDVPRFDADPRPRPSPWLMQWQR
jgi:hypothetical protein